MCLLSSIILPSTRIWERFDLLRRNPFWFDLLWGQVRTATLIQKQIIVHFSNDIHERDSYVIIWIRLITFLWWETMKDWYDLEDSCTSSGPVRHIFEYFHYKRRDAGGVYTRTMLLIPDDRLIHFNSWKCMFNSITIFWFKPWHVHYIARGNPRRPGKPCSYRKL